MTNILILYKCNICKFYCHMIFIRSAVFFISGANHSPLGSSSSLSCMPTHERQRQREVEGEKNRERMRESVKERDRKRRREREKSRERGRDRG